MYEMVSTIKTVLNTQNVLIEQISGAFLSHTVNFNK